MSLSPTLNILNFLSLSSVLVSVTILNILSCLSLSLSTCPACPVFELLDTDEMSACPEPLIVPNSFKSFSEGVTNYTSACLTANLQATQGQLEYVQNELKEAQGKLYQACLNEQRALDKLQLAIPPPAAPAAPAAPATFTVVEGEASASIPTSAPMASPTSTPAPTPALSTAELFMMTYAAKPSECIPDPDKFEGD
ncbi:hypothetical protein HOO65_030543 [Ceratocystis lukuohia]|uniref:Uncharacterized protein n=1 Tax=Ceratocystis lukuohia TaxID=2019550 RepID=A0ABR4ML77_9PEZI